MMYSGALYVSTSLRLPTYHLLIEELPAPLTHCANCEEANA